MVGGKQKPVQGAYKEFWIDGEQKYGGADQIQSKQIPIFPHIKNYIKDANLILFGPGSYLTSFVGFLWLQELRQEIKNKTDAEKVLIFNITKSNETEGLTPEDIVQHLLTPLQGDKLTHYIRHVILHDPGRIKAQTGELFFTEAETNDLERIFKEDHGVEVHKENYEDYRFKGLAVVHDADLVQSKLLEIVGGFRKEWMALTNSCTLRI